MFDNATHNSSDLLTNPDGGGPRTGGATSFNQVNNNPLFAKSELDWFDFETRVRRIIYDLLLPVNTKMKEVKESNE